MSRVLILGGTGFIARHLVKYLIDQQVVSKIRVVDKQLPATAYLNQDFLTYYNNPIVEYKQANLNNPAHIGRAFDDADGNWNYVINLAAETRYGQDENQYKQMCLNVSVSCAKEAQQRGVDRFIEVSTAQVYEPGKKPSKEDGKYKPWTLLAKYKKQAEDAISTIPDLNYAILRPAIVYGPSDLNGLMPRLVCAATYTHTKDKMKLLWTGDLRINTVHVDDVVRAIWHLCSSKNAQVQKRGAVFNVADKSDTSQESFNKILEQLFGIDSGFFGTIISNVAKLKIQAAAETANDNHMNPWADMCKLSNVQHSPLSPYIDKELLYNTSLSVDGSAIEKTDFTYLHPEISTELVQQSIQYWKDMNLFPEFQKLSK